MLAVIVTVAALLATAVTEAAIPVGTSAVLVPPELLNQVKLPAVFAGTLAVVIAKVTDPADPLTMVSDCDPTTTAVATTVTTHADEVILVPSVEVAQTFVLPVLTAVTSPVALTLATPGMLLFQVTFGSVALLGRTEAVIVSVAPGTSKSVDLFRAMLLTTMGLFVEPPPEPEVEPEDVGLWQPESSKANEQLTRLVKNLRTNNLNWLEFRVYENSCQISKH